MITIIALKHPLRLGWVLATSPFVAIQFRFTGEGTLIAVLTNILINSSQLSVFLVQMLHQPSVACIGLGTFRVRALDAAHWLGGSGRLVGWCIGLVAIGGVGRSA